MQVTGKTEKKLKLILKPYLQKITIKIEHNRIIHVWAGKWLSQILQELSIIMLQLTSSLFALFSYQKTVDI